MKKKQEQNNERQYWLWVTTPNYYLDEDGSEREALEPRDYSDAGGWWTCSRRTRKGDLILLYRARGKFDIKYLIQADSDAYPLGDSEDAVNMGWAWGCDYRPIYKFKNPIIISDLRSHERLQEWNALKAQFRSRSFEISSDDWQRLNDLAAQKDPRYKTFLKKFESVRVPENILLEEQLEDAVVKNLSVFRKFGYDLSLYYDEESRISGRQFVCLGFGGRIDLLCANNKTKGYTVIELKVVQANRLTFAQICEYLAYIQSRFGKRVKVDGIVVSRGYDASFQQAAKMLPGQIKQIDVQELGFN